MDETKRQQLIDKHRDSLNRHGVSSRSLFWESRAVQRARFMALAGIGIRPGDSVLDVGCGFGDLHSWLAGQGIEVDYTGLDLSPELIEKARTLHARARFFDGDIFDMKSEPQAFDWVVLSGTLNWQLDDDGDYARRVIRRMYELCRRGTAFNMLNAGYWKKQPLPGMAAFDPNEMLAFCKQITPDCTCRTDYLEEDFTIYMRRI